MFRDWSSLHLGIDVYRDVEGGWGQEMEFFRLVDERGAACFAKYTCVLDASVDFSTLIWSLLRYIRDADR